MSSGPHGDPPPPPSYNEVMKSDFTRRGSDFSRRGSESHAGINERASDLSSVDKALPRPAWLYHFPQQSQFNSPFTSLQYEDLEHTGTIPVLPTTISLDLGEDPVQLTCPYCHVVVVTVVEEEAGCLAYVLSALLCVIGCWPCAVIPCCIKDLMDVTHTCPSCKRFLDTYKRKI